MTAQQHYNEALSPAQLVIQDPWEPDGSGPLEEPDRWPAMSSVPDYLD